MYPFCPVNASTISINGNRPAACSKTVSSLYLMIKFEGSDAHVLIRSQATEQI